MNVVWAGIARRDFSSALAYVAEASPQAAERKRILSVVELLETTPYPGRASALAGHREHPVARTPYRLVYRLTATEVLLVASIRHARDWA